MLAVTSVSWLLALAAASAGLVFAISFRYALHEARCPLDPRWRPELPRAIVVHDSARERMRRGSRDWQRRGALGTLQMLQAIFVAFGITAVFVMVLFIASFVMLLAAGV